MALVGLGVECPVVVAKKERKFFHLRLPGKEQQAPASTDWLEYGVRQWMGSQGKQRARPSCRWDPMMWTGW